ncbi:uncharacterized protein LOC129940353 [Eupeodes corollae]|uniref:uncharacterized protein LOC129940353 n=1 Tax=Eupeodes corollae TaxID=290404 RepID=UPI0024913C07|nr:uncharacterized protein LOC129940353 [Eupeodes corollae]
MATTVNKIARGNLNFKPWIAAKNTTEIVNSYVQQLYRKSPDNFKNDLYKPRVVAGKSENRVPFQKVILEKINIPIISNKPSSKLRSNGYRSPAITRKNSFVNSTKKLLKTPNFKIYPKRRYASSVSSSKSNDIRNKLNIQEEYRRKIYKPVQSSQRIREIESLIPKTNYYGQYAKKIDDSPTICTDLMSVDDVLKKKICPIKKKVPSGELETPKEDSWNLSFKGWNNPSIEHYNKLMTIPIIRKPENGKNENYVSGLSPFRLLPIKAKIPNFGIPPKKQNPRLQSPGSSYSKRFNLNPAVTSTKTRRTEKDQCLDFDNLGGVSSRFNNLKIASKGKSEQKYQKSSDLKNDLDFVCLSRAEQSIRQRNQRGFLGNFRL